MIRTSNAWNLRQKTLSFGSIYYLCATKCKVWNILEKKRNVSPSEFVVEVIFLEQSGVREILKHEQVNVLAEAKCKKWGRRYQP